MSLDLDTQIEFLLFDQEKIVTYKEINNRFDITPKEAKLVLKKFVDERRKSSKSSNKKGDIHIVYLLILENRENKNKKIQLANENEVDKFEEEYKIISKQIYSIQLKPINDFNLIYSSDIDASNNVKRKMNLNVIFGEHEQENLSEPSKTAGSHHRQDDKQANKSGTNKPNANNNNDQSNILRPSKDSNLDNKQPQKRPSTETAKAQANELKVKDEPTEKKSEASLVKKVKLESTEPSVTTNNIASVKSSSSASSTAKPATTNTAAAKKAPAKPAQQATLTSFFKKV